MINKYKSQSEFLVFGENIKFPEELEFELIEENVNIKDNINLPILDYNDLIKTLINPKIKTTDKILTKHKINTFDDLSNAHTLIQMKIAPFSKNIRELIEQKYINVLDHVLFN
jgi:hypothetical protein